MCKYHRWSNNDICYIKRHKDKLTAIEISEHIGVTARSVYSKCATLGIKLKKNPNNNSLSKINSDDAELIRQLNEIGVKPNEIADKFGISRNHVYNILNYRYW